MSTEPPAQPTPGPPDPPLPELYQAELDAGGLASLVRDITACGELSEVIPKFSATGHVPEAGVLTAEAGHRLLVDGGARAVQFRYRFEGVDWWDTVSALPGGRFRLVRIQHDFSKVPAAGGEGGGCRS